MLSERLPRISLGHFPTPVTALPRLSAWPEGLDLWFKRDDQTGLAMGGNKTRTLELLPAEAEAQGARTLVTRGAVQSNHCRQTAAAAAARGLQSILVLRGEPPTSVNGNLSLDPLLGAQLGWTHGIDPQSVLE